MNRLTGALPSPPDGRDWSLGKFGAAWPAAPLPGRVDNRHLVEEVYDQLGSSCTGWGTTRAWFTRARIQGDTQVKYPSAPLIYTLGRCALVGDPNAPLLDDGCWPRLTLLAAKQLGMVPLEDWNHPADQNKRPDWGTLREASDRRAVSFARVYGVDDMQLSLAMGMPLVVAFEVDNRFGDYMGGVWDGKLSGPKSGHATCILGYDFDAPEEYFDGVNSWSAGWGEGGCYRISKRCIPTLPRFEAWAVQVVNAEAA